MSKKQKSARAPVARAEPEIRSCCPTCRTGKVKADKGTRRFDRPLPHPQGGYRIGTRYLLCECGQNYAVPVIDRAAEGEDG